jgi:HSP20 family molecular chaperone IbpA
MAEISRRPQLPSLPEIGEMLDPFHLLWGGRAPADSYGIRIETRLEEDAYEVRAELPGIDASKDVEVTVTDGVLAIRAERSEQKETQHHTEFRYGSYTRSLRLPDGAKQDAVAATYKAGILAIRVPLEKAAKSTSYAVKVEAGE